MSFSADIKSEISKIDASKEELISELSGCLRNCGSFDNNIKIYIENNALARRIFKLFRNIYHLTPIITVRKRYNFNKNLCYILEINTKKSLILSDLSIFEDDIYLNIPKEYIISDEELVKAYLRGVFLSTGSINDPKKSGYHLEFMIDNSEYALFINNLLNKFNLKSKIIKRDKNYMVYIKEAEKISDFLRMIKSYKGLLEFENIRIYRDHKNMTNRLNNCEQANVDKIFMSSNYQLKDINKLRDYDLIDTLDDKLKEVIKYRERYPESSLLELSEIITKDTGNRITKSGLNHRFRKIKQIIKDIENGREDKNDII